MRTDKILFSLAALAIVVGIIFSLSLPVFTILFFDYAEYHFFLRQFAVGMVAITLMWAISQLDPDKYLIYIGFSVFLSCLLLTGVRYLRWSCLTAGRSVRFLLP